MRTIVSKGEFARRAARSPACVTKWIATGKISPDALIGDGRHAQIWLERAMSDLSATLDPSQQVSQERPFQGPITIPASAYTEPTEQRAVPSDPIVNPIMAEREKDQARRAKADADKAEHDAEAARRKLALDEGKYVVAEEAAASFGREMAKFIGDTELFIINHLAREIAESNNLDWKSVSAQAREAYRQFRATASADARERRDSLKRGS